MNRILAPLVVFLGLVISASAAARNFNVCTSITSSNDGFYISTEPDTDAVDTSPLGFQYMNIIKDGIHLDIPLGSAIDTAALGVGSKCRTAPGSITEARLSQDDTHYETLHVTYDCCGIDNGYGKLEDMRIALDIHATGSSSIQVKSPTLNWDMQLKPEN